MAIAGNNKLALKGLDEQGKCLQLKPVIDSKTRFYLQATCIQSSHFLLPLLLILRSKVHAPFLEFAGSLCDNFTCNLVKAPSHFNIVNFSSSKCQPSLVNASQFKIMKCPILNNY